ncbi:MAG: N-acetylmuramoyl-L-alanine amidase [Chromatiaceae bacterium]|nr:N-acetylmuramoyl-L-alanine amidase [Chromatiaceae bacterium]
MLSHAQRQAVHGRRYRRWHAEKGFKRDDLARLGAGPWAGLGRHAGDLCCIGYHFVIRLNGVVEVGRRLTEVGAHEQRANADGIGVCLIGTDGFTPAQWASLRKHIVSTHESRRRERLPPVDVIGHRDLDDGRTCEMAGLGANQARAFALMAVAEALLDEAEARELAGTFADLSIYRQRDEMEARRLRALALDMSTKADGLKD